ncbi:WD40 repeat domain-containing protein [Actinomadura decatromicini]|uniref:WD40 repeat domain-containing protein n=1 Tax=Actinomadura decatromicini TaxID=2604572 RepID=A0A5D3FXC3_9ACTN|nr:hypothetical protein [Actinomadura decatromicini]TYK52556.1 hypothetical protein FXF68_01925 [Actinomadura decatromicini]
MAERRRAERWTAMAAKRGPLGHWAERRLFRAAGDGDAAARDGVVEIARTDGHRLRGRAAATVAGWWVETRDPSLRRVVVETGAVADDQPGRLLTLALHDRLDEWLVAEVQWAPALLTETDADVRAAAAAACENAAGAMLRALWSLYTEPGMPLRDVLLRNGTPPPDKSLNVLWNEWLTVPSPGTGEALLRWGRPATAGRSVPQTVVAVENDRDVLLRDPNRKALLDAIVRADDHPLYDIAVEKFHALRDRSLVDELCERALTDPAAARFCVAHRLAPSDPVRRALFYLLTRQPGQLRALDPDAGLLSLAYAAAPGEDRARVRDAMLTAGDLDLVRVIVGDDRRARFAAMPAAEARYLAERLAVRRDWPALWALVQDLPVTAAIELVRLFDGWLPRTDEERRLFGLLREADPEAVAAGAASLGGLRRTAVPQASLLFHGRVNDVSFAPDGPFLAVAAMTKAAGVFDLRTAELIARYDAFNSSVGRVLHLGDGTIVAGEQPNHGQAECRLLRCSPGRVRELHTTPGAVTSLALTRRDGSFAAATRSGDLLLGAPGGELRVQPLAELGLGRRQWPRLIAAHRGSGRIALLGRSVHLLDEAAESATTMFPGTALVHAEFLDAENLVCARQDGTITRASLRASPDAAYVPEARTQVPGFAGLGVQDRTGRVIVADGSGDLHLLRGAELDAVGVLAAPRPGKPTGLTLSPDGEFLAVGHRNGRVDLYDLALHTVPELIRHPVADLVPRDLGLVEAFAAEPGVGGKARVALDLVRACLEHRFRFDVELGAAERLKAGEHDISL